MIFFVFVFFIAFFVFKCQFCTEKKNADKLGLPEDFAVFAEIAEATNSILDTKVKILGIKFAESYSFWDSFISRYR